MWRGARRPLCALPSPPPDVYLFLYLFFSPCGVQQCSSPAVAVAPPPSFHSDVCVFIVARAVQSAALHIFCSIDASQVVNAAGRLFTTHHIRASPFFLKILFLTLRFCLPQASRFKRRRFLIVFPHQSQQTGGQRHSKWSWSGSTCFDSSGRTRGRRRRHPHRRPPFKTQRSRKGVMTGVPGGKQTVVLFCLFFSP